MPGFRNAACCCLYSLCHRYKDRQYTGETDTEQINRETDRQAVQGQTDSEQRNRETGSTQDRADSKQRNRETGITQDRQTVNRETERQAVHRTVRQ